MTPKNIIRIAIAAIILIGAIIGFNGLVGKNDDQNWQILQFPNGSVTVVDSPGYYVKWFGTVTTYPRNWQFEFTQEITKESPTDESTRVTFNDGSTADIDAMVRFSSPSTVEQKREFHRLFGGNQENVKNAVWAHLSNVIKASGPLMSASENQASRKSEFNNVAFEQMNRGLYEMKRVERELKDQFDEKGKPITVYATEVILGSDGKPTVSQASPLAQVGITVNQFSVTETNYDESTRKQFAQKKDAFLAAERAKAQREEEVQQRLMIEQRGLREKAETEAKANQEKAMAVISAQKTKEVAETQAAQQLAVAKLNKETAETAALQQLEVARLERQAAEENARKVIELAKAEKERIELGGALTEEKKVLAEIEKEKAIGIARELAKVNVPQFIIGGGSGGSSETDIQNSMFNLFLMQKLGVLSEDSLKKPDTK
jgi:regulator of protease activity HflC (stomatin/prohibitin superfamily)